MFSLVPAPDTDNRTPPNLTFLIVPISKFSEILQRPKLFVWSYSKPSISYSVDVSIVPCPALPAI